MENYRQIKSIGKGAFGAAWLVQRIKDNQQFVAKEVKLSNMKPAERELAKHEIQMLRQLNHPNITKYVDHFEHKGSLFIVMEYANGGDLFTKIQSRNSNRFTEKEVLHYFSQICLALLHLHEKRILHRDLKTQNVFLTSDGIVKLGDFGISTVLRSTYELKRTVCGTPYYFSPELCLSKPYNNKSDVWALGCILYELVTLKHAFNGNSMQALVQKILKGVYPPVHPSYSADLSKLIASMLKIDPTQRPNVQQIVQLPFIRAFLQGLQQDIQAKPLVDAEEKQRQQQEAQARIEANKLLEQRKQQAAAAAPAAAAAAVDVRERMRNQRVEQAQAAMELQIREHEDRLRQIRENQRRYDEEQAKRKKELDEKIREQRKVQDERAAQQAKVQKQREEEWERNMKQQQEDYRRRQEAGGMMGSPVVQPAAAAAAAAGRAGSAGVVAGGGGSPTPGAAGYDAASAARIYREMREAAAANRARALDNLGTPSPHRQVSPPSGDALYYGLPQQQAAVQRASPITSAPQQQPAGRSPVAGGGGAVDIEEARRAAYWQMRREAEDNRRRILGLDPLPQGASPPPSAAPLRNAAPIRQPAPQQPPAMSPTDVNGGVYRNRSPPSNPQGAVAVSSPPSPLPAVAQFPPPVVAETQQGGVDGSGNSSDDEEVGFRQFLNGEAIVQPPSHPQNDDLSGVQNVIQQALYDQSRCASSSAHVPTDGGAPAGSDDFGDPDDADPTRFVLDGQTLHLPNCTAGDPLMSRIESLRLFLETAMGEDAFIRAYRRLDSITEDEDDVVDQVEAMLPTSLHRFIPVISQLLVCESFFNRQ